MAEREEECEEGLLKIKQHERRLIEVKSKEGVLRRHAKRGGGDNSVSVIECDEEIERGVCVCVCTQERERETERERQRDRDTKKRGIH